MCDMHMLFKTENVCLRVADSHFISDHICARTFQTHMHRLLPEDLAFASKKVFSIFSIPLLPILLSEIDM